MDLLSCMLEEVTSAFAFSEVLSVAKADVTSSGMRDGRSMEFRTCKLTAGVSH